VGQSRNSGEPQSDYPFTSGEAEDVPNYFGQRDVFVLAGRAVWAPAGAEFDLAFVEVFVELGPFLAGGFPVLLDRSELAAVVEEGDVVADDVLVEDGDVAAGGLDVEVAE
jgi:hypothetical protein